MSPKMDKPNKSNNSQQQPSTSRGRPPGGSAENTPRRRRLLPNLPNGASGRSSGSQEAGPSNNQRHSPVRRQQRLSRRDLARPRAQEEPCCSHSVRVQPGERKIHSADRAVDDCGEVRSEIIVLVEQSPTRSVPPRGRQGLNPIEVPPIKKRAESAPSVRRPAVRSRLVGDNRPQQWQRGFRPATSNDNLYKRLCWRIRVVGCTMLYRYYLRKRQISDQFRIMNAGLARLNSQNR